MAVIDERDLVTAIRHRVENSLANRSSSEDQRSKAFKQFMGIDDTVSARNGASQVQSMDVNSMVTAVSAQMAVSFSTDAIASFTANSQDDEAQAQAESSAVNKIVVEDNGGFRTLLGGVQSALLYRTGYAKVYWHINRTRQVVRHSGITLDDLPVITENTDAGTERRLIAFNPKKGTASVEITKTTRALRVRPVINDRFFYDLDWDQADIQECPLVGEVYYYTRDELARQGVDPAIIATLRSTEKNSGAESTERTGNRLSEGLKALGKAMETVRIYDCYVRMSIDDGDYAFLYHVRMGDSGEPLFLEEPELVDINPYACGTAFPIVGRHDGESLAEKLTHIQAGKTDMIRQWYANVRSCSYGRYGAVVGQVDADDILNPVGGGAIRMKRPDAIVPIPVIDVGMSIKAALDQFDAMRTEMGGASVDFLRADAQIAQDTAHGTERVYASKEFLVSYMTRNLAESLIRGVYLIAHAQLRTGEGGPIAVKVSDQWQEVDPTGWQPRSHCKVNVAYSMGERAQISSALFAAIQLAKEALANGMEGQLVTKQGLYRMVLDWLTMQLVSNPDSYFIDPTSPQAQQAAADIQAANQKAQLEAARQQAEILAMPERIKADNDKDKVAAELEFKYFDTIIDAMTKADDTQTKMVVDIANAREQAKAARIANAGPDSGVKADAAE